MRIRARYFGILLIILLLLTGCSALFGARGGAASADGGYVIKEWYQKNIQKFYFSPTEGCAYSLSVKENSSMPIQRITYSAYQISINTEDIDKDEDGNILNPFAKDGEGNDIDGIAVTAIDYSNYDVHGDRLLSFEVTAHEWAAYIFTVEYNSGGELLRDEGNFLYCTVIDSLSPMIQLYETPVFQDNGYLFEYRITEGGYGDGRSATSGFKRIRAFRVINGESQTLYEHTSFKNPLTYYGTVLAVKGEYFVEAEDNVGNKRTVTLIRIDRDFSEIATENAAEQYLERADAYAPALIDALRTDYVAWQLLLLDATSAESAVESAHTRVLESLNACFNANKEFKIRSINADYVGAPAVENFDADSYQNILFGETLTLNIAFAAFDAASYGKPEALHVAALPSAERVLAMTVYLSSSLRQPEQGEFEQPLKLTLRLGEYKDIAAVASHTVDGQTVYTKLRVDKGEGWVAIYLPYTDASVSLVIESGEKSPDLRYLYLLFLILPIGGGVAFIFRKRLAARFRKKADGGK